LSSNSREQRVLISREGDKLIIKPVRTSIGLLELLAKWRPLDEDFPEIKGKPVMPEDIF
jgi:antitoxin VapB